MPEGTESTKKSDSSTTKAAATPAAKSTAKATAKPAAKSTAKPAAKPAAKTAAKPAAKAAAKPAVKPAAKAATKPAAKTETKPAAKKAAEPAAKTAAKPATKPAAKAAEKPAVKKTAPATSEKKAPAKTAAKSTAKATTKPAAKKVAEPAAKAAEKPAAKTTAKPAPKKATAKKTAAKPAAKKAATPAPKAAPKPAEEAPKAPAPAAEDAPIEAPVQKAAPAKDAPEFSDLPGVLIAAVEATPLIKIGGLADVIGALPKYLQKLGVDARIIMPFHRAIKERYATQTQHICDFQASLGWRSQYVGVERLELDGVVYYFIDNEFYFSGPVYCGGEFEGEQYAFFTRAVMDCIPQLDFDVKILHCNDWHTAMMPLLAKTQYQGGMQNGLRTLLTIHNLHFQGQFSHEFDRDLLRVDDSLATPQFVEHYGCDNMLKAGIVFSDKVNTVSPTYAREICEPYLGETLDGVLRSRGGDLVGILNGVDTELWNPETDIDLPEHFSADDLSGKAKIKAALLEELGLEPAPEGAEVPLIAMVGRLTPQKGIDLVQRVLDDIMAEDVRMIVLGSGDKEYEDFLREAENRYKGRLCSFIGYAGELSHRIYAGADLFLMPSLFEPCGLSQMIAMRYGTLPVVRETGGLKDTIQPYNEFTGEGNGFSFANYNAYEMLNTLRYALWVWRNPDSRKRLISQAMASDYSFERCARSYAELYRQLNW